MITKYLGSTKLVGNCQLAYAIDQTTSTSPVDTILANDLETVHFRAAEQFSTILKLSNQDRLKITRHELWKAQELDLESLQNCHSIQEKRNHCVGIITNS